MPTPKTAIQLIDCADRKGVEFAIDAPNFTESTFRRRVRSLNGAARGMDSAPDEK